MPDLKSSTALLGDSWPAISIGADIFLTQEKWLEQTLNHQYDVVGVPSRWLNHKKMVESLLSHLEKARHLQIVIQKDSKDSSTELIQFINRFPIISLVSVNSKGVEQTLITALEFSQTRRQELQLQELVKAQNEKLNSLYVDLEDRVQKRSLYLQEARRKNLVAQSRWETVRSATLASHLANSVPEMERLLKNELSQSLQISVIRILFRPQDEHFNQQQRLSPVFTSFQSPIYRSDDREIIGSVTFLREKDRPFYRQETDFLLKIADVISLAVDRLHQLEQCETIKEQWETTFNSVTDPMAMIDSNYRIIQSNRAYQKKTKFLANEIEGQLCHRVLFHRDTPCENCARGQNFKLQDQDSNLTYSVYSQPLQLDQAAGTNFIVQYHDISEKLRSETKLLETTKSGELGTISSSIAHELNNPLGGILSYLHLIKEDLGTQSPFLPDVLEMENGVRRCRTIIDNLLFFVRKPAEAEAQQFDAVLVVFKSIQMVELQTRSLGVSIKFNQNKLSFMLRGSETAIFQAFQLLMQECVKGMMTESKNNKEFRGIIEVTMTQASHEFRVSLIDNLRTPFDVNDSRISMARQILLDHGAKVEFSSAQKAFRSIKISFSSLVLA